MSEPRNSFERLMGLFKDNAKLITVDPVSTKQTTSSDGQLGSPDSVLVLVDGSCGNRAIIQYGIFTTYVIVSKNKIVFNKTEYSVVLAIQEKIEGEMKRRRISSALSNTDKLAIRCDGGDLPIQPFGYDPNFFTDPKNCIVTKYIQTDQPDVVIKQQTGYDVDSKLNYELTGSDFIIKVKASTINPQTESPQ